MINVILSIFVVAGVILLFDSIVYVFNPQRGRELMALQSAFFHSLRKKDTKPKHHRRSTDAPKEVHVHRRSEPRKSMLMTIRGYLPGKEDDEHVS